MKKRGSYEHFLEVAKKKQSLGDIVSNVMTYSQCSLLNMSSQPTWIRKHLVTMHTLQTRISEEYLTATEIADRMSLSSINTNVVKYPIYLYYGPEMSVGKLGMELETNDIYAIINLSKLYLKVNSVVVVVTPQQFECLSAASSYETNMDMAAYNIYLQEILGKKYKN